MVSLNKVFLMGNLTRDPELRYTANGISLANFGLAINRRFRQGEELKEEVCFVDIVVWGKQAESCSEFLSKGRGVFIDGRLHYRTWETEEGQKRSKVEVVANSVQFLPRSGVRQETNAGDELSTQSHENMAASGKEETTSPVNDNISPIDDIPF